MDSSFKTYIALENKRALVLENPVTIKEKDRTGKTKKIRQIVYIAGMDTIYVDEIKKLDPNIDIQKAKTPIWIKKGKLKVDNSEKNLIEFLSKTTQNEENGGKAFKLLDINAEEEFETQIIDEITDARSKLRNANDVQIKALAIQFLGYNYRNKSVARCKIDLTNAIENRRLTKAQLKGGKTKSFAKKISEWFENKDNETLLAISKAIDNDILSIRNGKVYLLGKTAQDEDELVFTGTSNQTIMEDFAKYLRIDKKGIELLGIIAKRIKETK